MPGTTKDFKANYDVDVSELEERIMEQCLLPPSARKVSLKLTVSSGVISGSVKWSGEQFLVNGAPKRLKCPKYTIDKDRSFLI